tara:strand:+ start:1012 stop:2118 length:1107 start_codon:yes stop_codon:yes gene_type:complete
MKIFVLSLVALLTFLFVKLIANPKDYNHYEVIDKIEKIEIRKYRKLVYASYKPKNANDRNNSFSNVAGYIFGGNNKELKIAMTSPVVIKKHNENEMAFVMPNKYNIENLPAPNNKYVNIYEEPSSIKAVISYSGYSNSKIEEDKIIELKETLKDNNIDHFNNFEVLIYNSPYQFINRKNEISVSINNVTMNNKEYNKIHIGGGCFWCIEAVFEGVIGIKNIVSGYSGGKIKNPSYKEVASGLTNHAEVCQITYDKKIIDLNDILKIFFFSHDPTTLNRQGNDIGKHYRSIILYNNEDEKIKIQNYISNIGNIYSEEIVTEIKKFDKFYKAEEYHQNYYENNGSQGYCRAVISPKVNKVRKELSKYYNK